MILWETRPVLRLESSFLLHDSFDGLKSQLSVIQVEENDEVVEEFDFNGPCFYILNCEDGKRQILLQKVLVEEAWQ